MRGTERDIEEEQAPCRDPDAGTPGSPPELKAAAPLLSHPGTPDFYIPKSLLSCRRWTVAALFGESLHFENDENPASSQTRDSVPD